MWFVSLLKLEGQGIKRTEAEFSGQFAIGKSQIKIDWITVSGT